MPLMTDQEALDFLVEKFGKKARVADEIGVTAQVLGNWYERGISADRKPQVWALVNDHGGHLERDWLFPQRAA
jgi:hypothetical protein